MKYLFLFTLIALAIIFLFFRKPVPVNQRGIPHDWSYSTPERVDNQGLPIPLPVDNRY